MSAAPLSLHAIAKALGGIVAGRSVLAPGPGHSAKDRSLSVTVSATSPDGFLVHSHAGDDWRACQDYVRGKFGIAPFKPGRRFAPPRRQQVEEKPENNRTPEQDGLAKRNAALIIWNRAVEPRGTLVERYLNWRRLDLPDEAAFEAIRFHPRCIDDLPGVVCLVRNIITNEPQGIHRTALAPDGTAIKRDGKTLRKSLGQIADGAIKLTPDEAVEMGLCIGEGVETTLTGMQMGLRPAWSLINTGGIANFPLLPGIEGLHIFKENDANGASAKAVEACASRWHGLGCAVLIVTPNLGKDLNDEHREATACPR